MIYFMKEKIGKLDFKKSKLSFYKRHEKINIQWAKMFAADIFDKRLVSKLFSYQTDNKTYKLNKN